MCRKRMLKGLLALIMAGALMGCGAGEGTQNNVDTAVSEPIDAASTEAGEADSSEAEEELSDLEGEEFLETVDIAIGTTGYIVAVPDDYYKGEVTEKERKDDMIAYYKSDKELMDFDVYQFGKDGATLQEYTESEAHEYGADDFEELEINGITVTHYDSNEEYDGTSYQVANYLFETETDFAELSFWLDGEDADALVDQIINTLENKGTGEYDMYGFISEKLSDGEVSDEYAVKGDNDEIYNGYYLGEGELETGTPVGMLQIDEDEWRIEVTGSAD